MAATGNPIAEGWFSTSGGNPRSVQEKRRDDLLRIEFFQSFSLLSFLLFLFCNDFYDYHNEFYGVFILYYGVDSLYMIPMDFNYNT